MTERHPIEYFRSIGLLPFQAEFARDFLASDSPRLWELVAPVGTGKSSLIRAIIVSAFESGKERVLVLAPSAIVFQWQDQLSSSDEQIHPIKADRQKFLEFVTEATDPDNPWPDHATIVMGIDLAKRSDILPTLVSSEWDLVVLDESHHLSSGRRRLLLESLLEEGVAKRALLLTSSPGPAIQGVTRRVFERAQIEDWTGKPLFNDLARTWITLEYELTDEERGIVDSLDDFVHELIATGIFGELVASTFIRARSSSLVALESMLWRVLELWRPLRNQAAHGMMVSTAELAELQLALEAGVDATPAAELPPGLDADPNVLLALYSRVEMLVERIDEISSDSKFDALSKYLDNAFLDDERSTVCILTSFRATLDYLVSRLEDRHEPLFAVTSANSRENLLEVQTRLLEGGGILLLTEAGAESETLGVSLGLVYQCVTYDLPRDPQKLERFLERFSTLSRSRELKVARLEEVMNLRAPSFSP